ncbi:SusC/RagA family TonB-linked outer membrane protein [Salegentibacter mishustinae]|uniref:SusC/RagA family TonB-linked outer membrane protein n=1 Tax=Salegentibacter mishustinae TaxID=270918 RepID=A0A0Q9ZEJ2_9FLAO|nr:TonB-dependent receptor [Salegentibacter mishustinae]KRG28578.1 SusC/RagA family TonB-linked outer membrane protein [Salegentibacter mishustinae]PNW22511.1 SusC/RagA family TonB-linked outer membrane protein [Salegentibacter mishustinae]PZX67753.1 TonB-linked SusC/RagA family outer membrane protein [Salegentibacter mishustinae]GGW77586.1 SusC/RagA family TonB-linked outer membrane protein [Salegentibacter mishustinae]
MNRKLRSTLTLLLVLIAHISFAQQKTISGNVSDQDGLPLPGVNVLLKGTSTGTQTDFDGNYSIQAAQGDVLVFSFIGLETKEYTVGAVNTINVTLGDDSASLDEVVVVAYGTTSQEAFTGSASVIGAADLENRNVTSPIAAIEGKATGVQFTSPSGPGESPGIVIRGVGTLNGDTDPLFVVDGVPFEGSLSAINQEDIESFTVLKDAASTSLYGSRAANGVVMITTKSGTPGETKITLSAQTGIVNNGVSFYDQVSPGQYYEIMWEALKNSSAGGGDPQFASDNIYNQLAYNPFNVPNEEIVGVDGQLNPDAQVIYESLDWFDELTQTGIRTNYNMNVSAGGEDHSVYFSTSFLDEESYVITSGFERFTGRLNGEFDVSDKIKVGGNAYLTISEARGPSSAGTGSIVNPFGFALNVGSVYPVYVNDLNGNIVLDDFGNPVFDNGEGYPDFNIGSRPISQGRHAIQELILNNESDKDNYYGIRLFGEYEILDGLKVRLNYGRDISDLWEKEYENAVIGDAQPDGRLSETRARRDVENFNQLLTYNQSFGDHNLDITAGHESFDRSISDMDGLKTIQAANGIYEFANFSNIVDLDGATFDKGIEGYFLRTNYNFKDKYYISGSVRRDGSSVFQEGSRWGTFYSVGASWRIDQESFMDNVSFIDKLKVRASYGEVGNDDLGDSYLAQPRFTITSNAANPAILFTDIGNRDLVWETIESFDVALEFGLFNNFLEGSVEYYRRNSSDLLYNLPIALSNGLNQVPVNLGDMYNSGLEMALTANLINTAEFDWNLTLQASTFKNEITFLPDPFINGSKRWAEGRSRFDFFLLRTAGVDPETGDQLFYVYEDDDNGESVPVLDENGNIETTNDWQETQQAYTGDSSIPDLLGSVANSFSYKGFNLDFLITYGIGGSVLDNAYAGMMHSGSYGNSLHPDIMNAWREPGDITDVPRMENGNVNLVRTQSDRFLTDASFWALKNVNIGYSFGNETTNALGLDNLRISVTGENLYLKSERDGLDPQYNLAGTPPGDDFSPPRIISLGLNLSF